MEDQRFDTFAKALGRSPTRRAFVKALGVGLAGVLFGRLGTERALADTGDPGTHGNSAAAHFCAAVFGANTPAANQCTSDGAHGTGLSTTPCAAGPSNGTLCGGPSYASTTCCTGTTPTCCGGTCTNTQTSATNCGACGTSCVANPNGHVCVSGVCGCNSATDCPSGMACNTNTHVCAPACSAPNTICLNGEVCSGVFCQACSATVACPAGYTCRHGGCFKACTDSCGTGTCNENCACTSIVDGGNYCLDAGTFIGLCASDADCPQGSVCSEFASVGNPSKPNLCTRPCACPA